MRTIKLTPQRYTVALEAHAEHWTTAKPICPRCQRIATGWPLKRADVCAPPQWAQCLRNL